MINYFEGQNWKSETAMMRERNELCFLCSQSGSSFLSSRNWPNVIILVLYSEEKNKEMGRGVERRNGEGVQRLHLFFFFFCFLLNLPISG